MEINNKKEEEKESLISDSDSDSDKKSVINIKQHFPKRIVQKIEYSSYILITMESLAQIYKISKYFLDETIPSNDNGIAKEFKDYIENLWKIDEESNPFIPKRFLKKLKKISNNKFSFKEELKPYIFYDYILDKLNNELKDNNKNYFKGFEKNCQKYEEKEKNENLQKFVKEFINKNNSIISKTFYGIIQVKYICNKCGENKTEEEKYEFFNKIDIDILEFCNKKFNDGSSLLNINFDDLVDYYFNNNEVSKIRTKCDKCNKETENRREKKIILLPNFLIFRIKFDEPQNENLDFIQNTYKFIEVDDKIEMKKDYFIENLSYNNKNIIEDSVKFQIFNTIDYYNDKKIYICKYRIKEEGKENDWYSFWCNSKGKEVSTFIDQFTSPCLLFYEKI